VARLVNDADAGCRSLVGDALSTLLRRAGPPPRDRLAGYASRWLAGGDARLSRAAAQALGLMAEVEAAGFARRVAPLLPTLAGLLEARADMDDAAAEAAVEAGGEDLLAAAPGWQEAYYALLLLQRLLEGGGATAAPLAWAAGPPARRCWAATQRLLLHRHAWVRAAAGRLVGAALASPAVGGPWLAAGGAGAAGALALSFFRQLDSEAADEALAGQAVKCLVFLCTAMADDDAAAGRLPPPLRLPNGGAAQNGSTAEGDSQAGGGDEQEDSEEEEEEQEEDEKAGEEERRQDDGQAAAATQQDGSEEEEEEEEEEAAAEASAAEEAAAGSLSLQGLVRRMVRLADDKTYARQLHRGVALRFIAALASRLGPQRAPPFLPLLMRPLYRITEPGGRSAWLAGADACAGGCLALQRRPFCCGWPAAVRTQTLWLICSYFLPRHAMYNNG
jgi:U3 small nucleolar RNA-associated protein 20